MAAEVVELYLCGKGVLILEQREPTVSMHFCTEVIHGC